MRALLLSGVVLGPLFYTLVVFQMITRTGFDITRQPLSLLALGDGGWLQTANFILTGVLGLVFAVGLFGLGKGTVGAVSAVFVAVFGLGIILAGVFQSDPSMGFPPGAPEGVPATMSQSAMLHGVGFMVSFTALTLATAAFGLMLWDANRLFAISCFVVAVAIPVIIGVGMSRMDWASLAFFWVGALAFGWVAIAAYLFWSRG